MNSVHALRHLKSSLNLSESVPSALTPAQRSNFLTLTARGYATWRAHSLTLLTGQPFPLPREAQLFLHHARPRPGEWWLDAGTSAGFYAALLAQAGARVLAADLSPAMLRAARAHAPGARIDWALLNAERTGLPSASLDGVTIGATLNETRDPDALLRESARLVRPGGRVWLMYVARSGRFGQRALARAGGLTFPDPARVERHLRPLRRALLFQVGDVTFELYIRDL
ncbi:class I SAM-dependent methyltransferase [Deinococcus maricopensis]|uniref:Methyltransferase type 11 n=1 Tax=Deinococcus maricopensis (strain DSM 21211 / LMG 22137 / NRRL B-23946 / LB-34) TaxID=709986 RepID=E8UAM9_DEIML|nr:Methyltransferase type 11 [Deinococcus maricopensis DSM 21211]